MLSSIAVGVIALGTRRVKPWVYLSPTAHTISNSPATISSVHALLMSLPPLSSSAEAYITVASASMAQRVRAPSGSSSPEVDRRLIRTPEGPDGAPHPAGV